MCWTQSEQVQVLEAPSPIWQWQGDRTWQKWSLEDAWSWESMLKRGRGG